MNKNETYYATFNGKKYAFDFDELMRLSLYSESHQSSEVEITNGYGIPEIDTDDGDNDNDLQLITKVDRELKTTGNPQNDVISFEFIKIMIGVLLDEEIEKDSEPSFKVALALNTLIKMNILVEI